MIDGRTVWEIVPDLPSAKEGSELLVYIQQKLSRLIRDPTLIPDYGPYRRRS
jgi:hypothetical protein